ncbi:hypothetical protein [Actinomadura rubrisoli]|uniref:MFS transporter n=1 Tax=Actinomadura rubrisoli TaxID=2530368 RepID=A0A4R5C2L0_9ACTN|nr:hypothetical protein [Actinomadura rubrisoli]TDD91002.1 hypothetical protein E1298_12320 [Actinomadura rubrisoli]
MPVQPCFRLARAVVFATVCLILTTAGHAYAAHAAVPPGAVGLGFLLVTGLSLLLSGAERSFGTILGGLVGAQFGLHALFARASSGPVHGGPVHGGIGHHAAEPPVAATEPFAAVPGHGGVTMTLVHLGAALAAAWWLRRGDAALWALARRVSATAAGPWRLLAAALSPAEALAAPVPRFRVAVRPIADAPLRHALVRRGPPAR